MEKNNNTEEGELNEKSSSFTSDSSLGLKDRVIIDAKKQRYPYCLVWTPLPCITWLIPCIGHCGICNSEGIIHDFAGPYFVSENDMAFGNPTKYVILDLNEKEMKSIDGAVDIGRCSYNKMDYNFFTNNCHSFVAYCLNKLKYKNKNNYTMFDVWKIFFTQSKYISTWSFIQTNIGFMITLIFIGLIYFMLKK